MNTPDHLDAIATANEQQADELRGTADKLDTNARELRGMADRMRVIAEVTGERPTEEAQP